MSINYFLIGLIGFSIGMVLVFWLKQLALKDKVLIPKGIPLVGGISIGLAFVISCLFGFSLYEGLSIEVIGILISAFIILIFGIIDDWRELSIMAKFLVQVIATALLIFFGITTHIVYIGGLLNIIITFIWILAITNAFNHLDVMDGLAAGTAMIVSLAFFIVSILTGNIKTALLSVVLSGATISFLIYNLPPAKVYLGNSGSHFLGFILATVALLISYAPLERKVALFSPLLILGLPIFDTGFLVLVRLSKKRLPFKKSNDHLALRFLALGYSKKRALLLMSGLCLFFSFCGVVLMLVSNFLGIIIVAFAVLVSLIITYRMNQVVVDG